MKNKDQILYETHGDKDLNITDVKKAMDLYKAQGYTEDKQIIKDQYIAIGKQAVEISKLNNKLSDLQDTVTRRQDWIESAKKRVGVSNNISFDKIWAKVCEIYDKELIEFETL